MTRTRPLPSVELVAPDVWSIPVPIPGSTLGHVFVYALVGDDGVVLVDAGWDHEDARRALTDGLAVAGARLADVTGVAVTHVHADHYGLAGWVREASDAWIGLHPADAALVDARYRDPAPLLAAGDRWLRDVGAPDDAVARLRDASMEILGNVRAVDPDRALEDGAVLATGAGPLDVVHTPGHTPGHVCLAHAGTGAVFTGDHVLPRISPNVGWHPQSDPDPLRDYLTSLGRIVDLGADIGLPGHVHVVDAPGHRAEELQRHHDEELDAVESAVLAGAGTAWEVAGALSWSRPWDEIESFYQRAAVAEVCAHLIRLEADGRLRRESGTPMRWTAPAG